MTERERELLEGAIREALAAALDRYEAGLPDRVAEGMSGLLRHERKRLSYRARYAVRAGLDAAGAVDVMLELLRDVAALVEEEQAAGRKSPAMTRRRPDEGEQSRDLDAEAERIANDPVLMAAIVDNIVTRLASKPETVSRSERGIVRAYWRRRIMERLRDQAW
jgi:hypothetical protein